MNKHTRHHANPNTIGKDPDIDVDTISFLEEDAARDPGLCAWITRRQGYLFFPLLLLEGINLHVRSSSTVFGKGKVEGRWLEIIDDRAAARDRTSPRSSWLLPVGMAFAFLGVQLAVFGLYMGASFAPNHKGMPIMPPRRQDGLPHQAGAHLAQHQGGWLMDDLHGRPQLPDRAPPVPEHAAPAHGEGQ